MDLYINFLKNFSQFLVNKKLKHLILHVTNHCNFRCSHCFVDFSGKQKDLKINNYEKLSKEVGELLWLDVGGGEPFLRKDLYKIVNLFKKKVVAIPTNGFLTENIIDQVKKINTSNSELTINFSLDGLKDTHNKIRKNNQSWDKVWETYFKIKKYNKIKLRFITVITNQNFDEIIPLMKIVKENGADFHSVMLLRGDTLDDHVELPELNKLKNLGSEIFNILATYKYGLNSVSSHLLKNYHRYMWKVSLDTIERKKQVVPCLAGKSNMVIWGNGDLSSCEMLPSVGNINQKSFSEIVHSDEFKKQLRSIENKECHCTHNCALLTSIFFNPKKWKNLIYQKKP